VVIWQLEGVAPAGVAVSWVWLQTFRWAQRDYKAATAAGYTGCEQQTTEERCMHAPRETAGLSSPNEPSQRVSTATRRDPSCYEVTQ
jgi:hypothetical protein